MFMLVIVAGKVTLAHQFFDPFAQRQREAFKAAQINQTRCSGCDAILSNFISYSIGKHDKP